MPGVTRKNRFVRWAVARPYWLKRLVLVATDAVALAFAVWAAYSLRLNTLYVPQGYAWLVIAAAPAIAVPVLAFLGQYRAVIRYFTERELATIVLGVVLSTLAWVTFLFVTSTISATLVPRSVPFIYASIAVILIAGSRFLLKYLLRDVRAHEGAPRGRTLIWGAGSTGVNLAAALQREQGRPVAGFVDDDSLLVGRDIGGARVHGPGAVHDLIRAKKVDEIVISTPSLGVRRRKEILESFAAEGIKIRFLPALSDIASGRYLVSQIREFDIDDLLGRSVVPPKIDLLKEMIEDRVILVSGAGGSIGSELCRLVARWRPKKLVLLEANEFALYEINRALAGRADAPVVAVLGSVGNDRLVRRAIEEHGVQAVFHAAAHKHVPLVEANIVEGVRNNIFGTRTIAEAALQLGVEDFVLISSDKAVRPSSAMGATKLWSEWIVLDCASRAAARNAKHRFCAVRFGNVLGSAGSVVPLFKEQIRGGGPVTLTDGRMTRYFMSIHEAAELIVQAGRLSEGSDVFLLEMGEPIRIRELAETMIHVSGLTVRSEARPDGDIEIVEVGQRPGEKLYEELFYNPSHTDPTTHPKILRAVREGANGFDVMAGLAALRAAVEADDAAATRRLLFAPIDTRPAAVTAGRPEEVPHGVPSLLPSASLS